MLINKRGSHSGPFFMGEISAHQVSNGLAELRRLIFKDKRTRIHGHW